MSNSDQEFWIKESWKNPEHLRLRIQPQCGDADYPVFRDLNDFIRKNGTSKKIAILDFGAGSSPYKIYFPNTDYQRADILQTTGLNYLIGTDSRIAAPDETFDLIISTQVLEHVENVNAYLTESFRLLKKGGVLLLTTHGTWEEHGVPFDFQRWTEEGLKRDLKLAGYHEITIHKLTCGLHAGLFLFIKSLFAANAPSSQPGRLLFKIFRTIVSRIFPLLYKCAEKLWPQDKIIQANPLAANQTFYIVIAATVRK